MIPDLTDDQVGVGVRRRLVVRSFRRSRSGVGLVEPIPVSWTCTGFRPVNRRLRSSPPIPFGQQVSGNVQVVSSGFRGVRPGDLYRCLKMIRLGSPGSCFSVLQESIFAVFV